MKWTLSRGGSGLTLFAAVGLFAFGCGQSPEPGGGVKDKVVNRAGGEKSPGGHVHGEWWCDEHGIPEHECSMCSARYAKECKDRGDWCDKHDRARSQCFLCEPALKEKFAAKHRARFGTEPPPIGEEEDLKPEGAKPGEKK